MNVTNEALTGTECRGARAESSVSNGGYGGMQIKVAPFIFVGIAGPRFV